MSVTVRVSDHTHSLLRDLARSQGGSLQETVERAVEAYRRSSIIEASNEAYAALRSDAAEWARVMDERRDWDTTLEDGLAGDR